MFQVATDTGSRLQTEGAAPGENQCVHTIRNMLGPKHVDFLRAGGGTANIDASYSARFT